MPTSAAALRMPDAVHRGSRSYTRGRLERMTTEHRVAAAIASGELIAVLPGRYASCAHHEALLVRAHAAAAATSGVVTGATGLFLLGGLDRGPRMVDIRMPHGRWAPRAPWLRVRRVQSLGAHTVGGMVPVADPAVAIVDAWTMSPPDRRAGEVLSALQRGLASTQEVRAELERRPRVRDRAALLDVVGAFDQGAHSFLELEGLTRVFVGPEWRGWVRQHLVLAQGRRRRLDMYEPGTRTAVELDGSRYHLAGERREADIERDAEVATLGILTVRLSYAAVMTRPDWCRRMVREVVASRGSRRTSRLNREAA